MRRHHRKPLMLKYVGLSVLMFGLAILVSIVTRMLLTLDFQFFSFTDDQASNIIGMIDGAVGAVAAGFLLYQLKIEEGVERRETEIHEAEFYQHFINYWLETDRMFLERPQCRKYFYDNADPSELPEDSPEFAEVMGFAEYFDDLFRYSETEIHHQLGSPIPDDQVRSYETYMASVKRSPGFEAYKKKYGGWINTSGDGKKEGNPCEANPV